VVNPEESRRILEEQVIIVKKQYNIPRFVEFHEFQVFAVKLEKAGKP
jgi:hypothetical protein